MVLNKTQTKEHHIQDMCTHISTVTSACHTMEVIVGSKVDVSTLQRQTPSMALFSLWKTKMHAGLLKISRK